jgi:hypothetical protein
MVRQHHRWVVSIHPLGDCVISHQISDAVLSVTGEVHDRVYIVAEIDEKAVGRGGIDELKHLGPGGSALHHVLDGR